MSTTKDKHSFRRRAWLNKSGLNSIQVVIEDEGWGQTRRYIDIRACNGTYVELDFSTGKHASQTKAQAKRKLCEVQKCLYAISKSLEDKSTA